MGRFLSWSRRCSRGRGEAWVAEGKIICFSVLYVVDLELVLEANREGMMPLLVDASTERFRPKDMGARHLFTGIQGLRYLIPFSPTTIHDQSLFWTSATQEIGSIV